MHVSIFLSIFGPMGIRPGITKMISNASCPVNLLDQLSSGCHGKGPLFHLRALAQTCSNLIGLLAKLPCTSLVAVKSLFELNVSSTINGNWSLQTSPMACHTCLCKNKMIREVLHVSCSQLHATLDSTVLLNRQRQDALGDQATMEDTTRFTNPLNEYDCFVENTLGLPWRP